MVESNARRVFPRSAPVSATTAFTASKIRFGSAEAASRRRQYVNVVGWNAAAVIGKPHAAFHRRSNVTASTVSLSDNPCKACNVITVAITSTGTDGRPDVPGNRSANIPSGNNSRRCAARNANTLPGFSSGLFLVTAIGAFLLVEGRMYWVAGTVGALATAGRPVGVAVAVGLLVRVVEIRAEAGAGRVPLGRAGGSAQDRSAVSGAP